MVSAPPSSERPPLPKRVVAVASNKGGVGKTFLATNLAVYLRALHEDLPVSLVALDDQTGIDRMFRLGARDPGAPNLKHALAERNLDRALQLGEYGIQFVPSPPDSGPLRTRARDPRVLRSMIERSAHGGLFLLDCKSDLEELTRSALRAADLVILPVADRASLEEAGKVFELLAKDGGPPGRARILFTLVDRRTRVGRDGRDLHDRLRDEFDQRSWPRFTSHVSRSPRVEALQSGSERSCPVLHEGRGTAVHRQLRELAEELSKSLDLSSLAPALEISPPRSTSRGRGGVKRSLLGGWLGER